MKKKMSVVIIGVLLAVTCGMSFVVSADELHSVWGYLYIKDMNDNTPEYVLTPAGATITLQFYQTKITSTTKGSNPSDPLYGWYQIDFMGFEDQTGTISVDFNGNNDLIPLSNVTATINFDSSEEGKGNNYHRNLYITIPETQSGGNPGDDDDDSTGGENQGIMMIITIPPIADASKTQQVGNVNEMILLDGSKSSDEDGTIVEYEWIINNDVSVFGKTVSYTFKEQGLYQIELLVTDDSGEQDTDTLSISVETGNQVPKDLTISGPKQGTKQNIIDFSISAIDLDNDTLTYLVNWGDNSPETESLTIQNGSVFETSHIWETYGKFLVKVSVKDQENATIEKSFNMFIDVIYVDDIITGLLIDIDGDGVYDVFNNTDTQIETEVQKQNDTTYLIDVDNDGQIDYSYNIYSEVMNEEVIESEDTINGSNNIMFIGGFVIILLVIVGFFIYSKRK